MQPSSQQHIYQCLANIRISYDKYIHIFTSRIYSDIHSAHLLNFAQNRSAPNRYRDVEYLCNTSQSLSYSHGNLI